MKVVSFSVILHHISNILSVFIRCAIVYHYRYTHTYVVSDERTIIMTPKMNADESKEYNVLVSEQKDRVSVKAGM